jgi:hypothetical protein
MNAIFLVLWPGLTHLIPSAQTCLQDAEYRGALEVVSL